MDGKRPGVLKKLRWSLPWLMRYPLWRAREIVRRATDASDLQHLIVVVANHFEPGWNRECSTLAWETQLKRLDHWCEQARAIGNAVRDMDGTPFRHTNFYPAEQYHAPLLERMAELQSEGFGEVEIHLHHGVEEPDTADNLRRALVDFRDVLAEEHRCLSRMTDDGPPMYAFVHGNWALANSASGKYCGVDSEMQILAETGCYADFTLPSAPDESQVARINAVYQSGHPLHQPKPHRSGPGLRVGDTPKLPLIITGPLVFDWRRRVRGVPVPRLDSGALIANYPTDMGRLNNWAGAHVSVGGRPDWVFVKLFCHGFFDFDQDAMIGDSMRRFWTEALELGEQTGRFKIHFASAREAFNMTMAAVEGQSGNPGDYRDYRLRQIMQEQRGRPSDQQVEQQAGVV